MHRRSMRYPRMSASPSSIELVDRLLIKEVSQVSEDEITLHTRFILAMQYVHLCYTSSFSFVCSNTATRLSSSWLRFR